MTALSAQVRLGVGLAVGGGRGARLRTAMTATGVALGVVVLLLAASVPHVLRARDARGLARQPLYGPSVTRMRLLETDTSFRGQSITGITLAAVRDAGQALVPPGLTRLPGPGQMDVSPALGRLLDTPQGAALRRRLDARVVSTIGHAGLISPNELTYYRGGGAELAATVPLSTVKGFGIRSTDSSSVPLTDLLIIVMIVALLLPVAVFVATAARFSSGDRDVRMAALRLVGADVATTARIAAAEALVGALTGLMFGGAGFLLVRSLAAGVTVAGISVFPSDIVPSLALTALVAVLVPLCAVAATLVSVRRAATSPLSVGARGAVRRRRVAWRLVVPLAGFALLVPLIGAPARVESTGGEIGAATGVVLVLIGLTAMMPWVVETLVRRAPDGPLPWLLAVRRLRQDEGTSGRTVAAIAMAVAGAIALQMLFGAAQTREHRETASSGVSPAGALSVSFRGAGRDYGAAALARLRAIPGVTAVVGTALTGDRDSQATIATCGTLIRLGVARSCTDGQVFIDTEQGDELHAGRRAKIDGRPVMIPSSAKTVTDGLPGLMLGQLLATPAAAQRIGLSAQSVAALVDVRPGDTAAGDQVRDQVAAIDPLGNVMSLAPYVDRTLVNLRRALTFGALIVLVMIGASLLVSAGDGLRERRRVLAVLAAFGTRRSTVVWSVLWQAVIPVACGLLLAIALGLALGRVLTAIVDIQPVYDWSTVAAMVATGAAVVAAVTALSLPTVARMMRPEALRVE